MKEVKKLLAQHKSEILPDSRVREKVKRDLGINSAESVLAYAQGGEHSVRNRRRTVIAAIAMFLVVAVVLAVVIPLAMKGGTPSDIIPPGSKLEITDADSFYAYGAASVGSIIAASGTGSASAQAASSAAVSAAVSAAGSVNGAGEGAQAQVDVVEKYLALVENLLSSADITSEVLSGSVIDGKQYAFGMKITVPDLLGGSVTYTMYYDKIFLSSSVDEEEREENYSIDGVLTVEGVYYPVEGRYSTETETEPDEEENETELYFIAYLGESRGDFIEITQNVEDETETEDGQTERERNLVCAIYKNGMLSERTELEYESEAGETELKLTITKDGRKEELVFEDEIEDGQRVMSVRGTLEGQRVAFRIYVRHGSYHYVFSDGDELDSDRFDDDDDHDPWDDDDD